MDDFRRALHALVAKYPAIAPHIGPIIPAPPPPDPLGERDVVVVEVLIEGARAKKDWAARPLIGFIIEDLHRKRPLSAALRAYLIECLSRVRDGVADPFLLKPPRGRPSVHTKYLWIATEKIERRRAGQKASQVDEDLGQEYGLDADTIARVATKYHREAAASLTSDDEKRMRIGALRALRDRLPLTEDERETLDRLISFDEEYLEYKAMALLNFKINLKLNRTKNTRY